MFWDVVKCFHPLWGSYHQSIQWLKWIHKWEVVNLTHRGLCETYPCFLSGLWQTTLERKLADMGVTVIHTQSKRGDRHYCRQTWKSAVRSSTLLLDSLPHTCTKSSVQKKVTQHCWFLTKGEFWSATDREILATEINVFFSVVSISSRLRLPLYWETSQRRCENAKPKYYQTNPIALCVSFQLNIVETCQKRLLGAVSCFCSHFLKHVVFYTISSWLLSCISYVVICWLGLSDYFMVQKEDITLQQNEEKRATERKRICQLYSCFIVGKFGLFENILSWLHREQCTSLTDLVLNQ